MSGASVTNVSVADALRAVSDAVALTLVTQTAWQRLLASAERLPLSSGGGLECYPDRPDRADLAVRYTASELTRLAPVPEIPPALAGLAKQWRTHGWSGMRMAWLELDVRVGQAPVSSVFAGVGYPPVGKPSANFDLTEWAAVVKALSPTFPPDAVNRVAWLQQLLPPDAWIGYLGVMRGNELRATISGMEPSHVPLLLHRLGWQGDINILQDLLDLASRTGARLTLGLELTGGIGKRLGIEIGLVGLDGWPALLSGTADLLPLSPASLAPLLAWAGESADAPGWPDRLRGSEIRIIRRLNHLKFVLDGAVPPQVKAYLYYGLLER